MTLHPHWQVPWGNILKHTVEKNQILQPSDYVSSHPGNLRAHWKTNSAEKLNKCNQCDFASSQAGKMITHLKTHSGKKLNKCNQCDYALARIHRLKTQWTKVKQMLPWNLPGGYLGSMQEITCDWPLWKWGKCTWIYSIILREGLEKRTFQLY